MDTSWVRFHRAMMGTPLPLLKSIHSSIHSCHLVQISITAFRILFCNYLFNICFPINHEHSESRDHLTHLCPPALSPVSDTAQALSKCVWPELGINGPLPGLVFPLLRPLVGTMDPPETWKYIPSQCNERFSRDF